MFQAEMSWTRGMFTGMRTRRKLTIEQVLEVRLLQAEGRVDLPKLAKKFGVHRESIKLAALGHTYKDVPMPPKRPR
jgi:hypothetical protein